MANWIVAARCNGWMKIAGDFETLDEVKTLATALITKENGTMPPACCDLTASDLEYMTSVMIYALAYTVQTQMTVEFTAITLGE